MNSVKTLGLTLLTLAAATPIFAVPAVPEISGDASGALTLVCGLALVLRSRRSR